MTKKNEILHGSALEKLKELESESVDCIITSPPYYKLRDYKTDGQLGQEETVKEYIDKLVTIFDEAKRVLKKEGTMFVVMGDSYDGNKSLSLIPDRFALEMTSRRGDLIKKESDKAWLAGIIEGEGCIHIHKREKGRKNATYGILLSIHNTNKKMIDKVVELTGLGGNLQTSKIGKYQTLYRWNAMSENAKSVLRDVYPYMVTKREQVRCALYCPSSGLEAEECFLNLKHLHHYEPVTTDYPEPETKGVNPWILRNTIIWAKKNCMPSSAKDRFTIDYEYIYFFTKSQKYYFKTQYEPYNGNESGWRKTGIKFGGNKAKGYGNPVYSGNEYIPNGNGRIKRCVWTINTKPFSEAHFAVFPEELVRQCLDAGCPENGTVLDCFMGSGTTALVALKNNRNFLGIELNQAYIDIALKRIEPYLYQTKLVLRRNES